MMFLEAKSGMMQKELAARWGVSCSRVHSILWEQGRRERQAQAARLGRLDCTKRRDIQRELGEELEKLARQPDPLDPAFYNPALLLVGRRLTGG